MEQAVELTTEQKVEAILANWGKPNPNQELPSRFQLGNNVNINFYNAGSLTGGKIIKVHFSPGKVMYDLEILVKLSPAGDEHNMYTRLYNVDSVFVKHLDDKD